MLFQYAGLLVLSAIVIGQSNPAYATVWPVGLDTYSSAAVIGDMIFFNGKTPMSFNGPGIFKKSPVTEAFVELPGSSNCTYGLIASAETLYCFYSDTGNKWSGRKGIFAYDTKINQGKVIVTPESSKLIDPYAMVVLGDHLFVSDQEKSIKKVSLATGDVSHLPISLPLGEQNYEISTDGVLLYVQTVRGHRTRENCLVSGLYRMDPANGSVAHITDILQDSLCGFGIGTGRMLIKDGRLYSLNFGGVQIDETDLSTGTTRTILTPKSAAKKFSDRVISSFGFVSLGQQGNPAIYILSPSGDTYLLLDLVTGLTISRESLFQY